MYRKELERMLAEGFSIQDILNHFMNNGKTAEEEQNEVNQRMQVCRFGVDTKQRLTKQRNHKPATVTKQRLLKNSDCYITAKNIVI